MTDDDRPEVLQELVDEIDDCEACVALTMGDDESIKTWFYDGEAIEDASLRTVVLLTSAGQDFLGALENDAIGEAAQRGQPDNAAEADDMGLIDATDEPGGQGFQ